MPIGSTVWLWVRNTYWGLVATMKIRNILRLYLNSKSMHRSDTIKLKMWTVKFSLAALMTWPCSCGSQRSQRRVWCAWQATEHSWYRLPSHQTASTSCLLLLTSQSSCGRLKVVNSWIHLEVMFKMFTKFAGRLTLASWSVGLKIPRWRYGTFKRES